MNFSKTTEYALRIMSFMAMDEKKLYRANDIFENLNIPFRYLRKLLTSLSKSGLLISIQGKKGGYKISRDLSKITISDIVHSTGDDQIKNECFFGFQNCAFVNKCIMHDKWEAIRNSINDVLNSTTLEELKETGPHNFISQNSLLFTKKD